jgi:GH24 family phage-related lysozyme (muramidase)
MPTQQHLTLSSDGLDKLKQREASVNGLYDDHSGYGTYGVGHLVHPDKAESFLLGSARTDKLCESRIKKMWPGRKYETPYLEREAIACKDYEELKTKAKTRALEVLARKRYKKSYSTLSDGEKATVKAAADAAVNREAQLLNQPVASVLKQDIRPFERTVNRAVTAVRLTQSEFDALVSLTFNIGGRRFANSSVLKKINENKYRNGDADAREKAIAEVESAFLAYNKSGGKVLDALTRRRQDEADQFLEKARDELKALKGAQGKVMSLTLP